VLGDGHQLHGIVAVALDDGENLLGELAVGAHPFALLGHPHVGLVDEQTAHLRDVEAVALPVEGVGVPELRRVVLRLVVLHHARGVGRDAVQPAVVAVDVDFVERAVRQPVAVHGRRQEDTPDAGRILAQPQLGALPVVEVAEEVDVVGAGQPFAEPPPVEVVVPLPAEIAVSVGIVDDVAGRSLNILHVVQVALTAAEKLPFDGGEPLVPFDHRKMSRRLFHSVSVAVDLLQIYEKIRCRRHPPTENRHPAAGKKAGPRPKRGPILKLSPKQGIGANRRPGLSRYSGPKG